MAKVGLSSDAKAQALGGLTAPLTFVLNGVTTTVTLEVTRFINQAGQLAVTGTILDAAGAVIATFTALVDRTQTSASCEILNLVLGPLTLDLLGLVITIPNPIVLNITAVSGPGNLLGNLLCAIAGLLDSGATTNALVRVLNRLLARLV